MREWNLSSETFEVKLLDFNLKGQGPILAHNSSFVYSENTTKKIFSTHFMTLVSFCTPWKKTSGINTSSRAEIFCKKDVLKILQNLQESTRAWASVSIKLQALVVLIRSEAATKGVLYRKVSQKSTCTRASFLIKNLALVFSCEFWEIFKNIFFIEHIWWLLLYEMG